VIVSKRTPTKEKPDKEKKQNEARRRLLNGHPSIASTYGGQTETPKVFLVSQEFATKIEIELSKEVLRTPNKEAVVT